MAAGIITGTVKVGTENGAPASSSIVRAYDRITGDLVTEVTADVNGEFSLTVPDDTRKYTLTAINNSFPGYNAGIDDNKYGLSGIDPWISIQQYIKNNRTNNTCLIENFDTGLVNYYIGSGNNVNFSNELTPYGNSVAININVSGTLGSRILTNIGPKIISRLSFKFYLKNIGSDDSGAILLYSNDRSAQKFSIFPRREPAIITGGPPVIIHNGITTSLFGSSSLTALIWYKLDMILLPGGTNSSFINITNLSSNTLVSSTKLPGHFPPFEITKLGFYVDFTGANLCQTQFTNIELC